MGFLGRRRSPSFELAIADGLYDGSFVIADAKWWNHEVEAQAKLRSAAHRPLTTEDVRRRCGIVQPQNRPVFEAVASAISLPGRQSTAVLSLAYALALIVDAGAGQTHNEAEAAPAWTQAHPFTANDLTELERHYSEEGHARWYNARLERTIRKVSW